jgi:hypothetical protein
VVRNSLWGQQGWGTTGGGYRQGGAHGGRRRPGNPHCLASLVGAVCRFSAQEGHGDGVGDGGQSGSRCGADL